MDGPSSKLAARFKRALETEEQRRDRERTEVERARQEGSAAREALFGQLSALGKDIGLRVETSASGLTLRHGAAYLHLQRDGDGERVKLAHDGLAATEELFLVRQPELHQRWVLVRRRGPRESRTPLFDQGVEDLLVRVLRLPPPSE